MSNTEDSRLKEMTAPIDDVAEAVHVENPVMEKPLSRVNRILTEEDLNSAGVRKMLLGQLDEYEQCKTDLNNTRRGFHSKDKECAVLTERIKALTVFDWLFSTLLTVGSILIGFYASQPDKGVILLVLGIIAVTISLFIKYKHSHENSVQ